MVTIIETYNWYLFRSLGGLVSKAKRVNKVFGKKKAAVKLLTCRNFSGPWNLRVVINYSGWKKRYVLEWVSNNGCARQMLLSNCCCFTVVYALSYITDMSLKTILKIYISTRTEHNRYGNVFPVLCKISLFISAACPSGPIAVMNLNVACESLPQANYPSKRRTCSIKISVYCSLPRGLMGTSSRREGCPIYCSLAFVSGWKLSPANTWPSSAT